MLYGLIQGAYEAASSVLCARRAPANKKGQTFEGVVPGIEEDDDFNHHHQHGRGSASSESAASQGFGSIAVVSDGVEMHPPPHASGRSTRAPTYGADGEEEGEADVEAGEGGAAGGEGEEASEGVVVIYIPERDLYFMPVNNTQVDRQGLIELMRDAGMEETLAPEVTADTLSHEDAVYILVDHGVTVYYGVVTDEAEGTLELYDPFEVVGEEEGQEGGEEEEGGSVSEAQAHSEVSAPQQIQQPALPAVSARSGFVAAPPLPPAGVPSLPVPPASVPSLPISRASSTGSAFPAPSPVGPVSPGMAFRGPPIAGAVARAGPPGSPAGPVSAPPLQVAGGQPMRLNAPPSPFTPFAGGMTPPPLGAAGAAPTVSAPASGRWA